MADSMMARILQMCDPTKLDGRDISRSLMTPLLSIPENMMVVCFSLKKFYQKSMGKEENVSFQIFFRNNSTEELPLI